MTLPALTPPPLPYPSPVMGDDALTAAFYKNLYWELAFCGEINDLLIPYIDASVSEINAALITGDVGDISGKGNNSIGVNSGATGLEFRTVANDLTRLGFAQSITSLGWQKLPNGLIMQWGTTGAIGAGASAAIAYPIAFPSARLSAVASPIGNNTSPTASNAAISAGTLSGATIYNWGAVTAQFSWLVIGG